MERDAWKDSVPFVVDYSAHPAGPNEPIPEPERRLTVDEMRKLSVEELGDYLETLPECRNRWTLSCPSYRKEVETREGSPPVVFGYNPRNYRNDRLGSSSGRDFQRSGRGGYQQNERRREEFGRGRERDQYDHRHQRDRSDDRRQHGWTQRRDERGRDQDYHRGGRNFSDNRKRRHDDSQRANESQDRGEKFARGDSFD